MKEKNNPSEYVSTRQAAKMLGLSVTMIQIMLERNQLSGWKTPGGHRRISILSLMNFKKEKAISSGLINFPTPTVMVVTEKILLQDELKKSTSELSFPFFYKWHDRMDAVISEMLNNQPDIFIVETNTSPELQGSTLSTLSILHALSPGMVIIMITEKKHAGITPTSGIHLMVGSLTSEWLKAFLAGVHITQTYLREGYR